MVEMIDVSGATHITSLKLGDSSSDYVNYSTNSITLGNNTLLRTLDVRNCPNLTVAPDVSGCTNIEEIYFDGTSITGLKLPNGGILKTLHLPATMANITLLNQTNITEFVMPNYDNVSTLWIENVSTAVPTDDILASMKDGSRVRLTNVDWVRTDTSILEKIATMRGLTETGENTDTAVVSGKLYIDAEMSVSNYFKYQSRFPYLDITAKSYVLDVLEDSNNKVWISSDNKLFMFADGGHTASCSGETIDVLIADKLKEE
jgi:hypothetical protein